MSIAKATENYFFYVYKAHHRSHLTRQEKVRTALAVISCFTIVIPGFFALVYCLSGFLSKATPQHESPKEIQIVAKRVEMAVPQAFLNLFPQMKKGGATAPFYINAIAKLLEADDRLIPCVSPLMNLEEPETLYITLQMMKDSGDLELCEQICNAFDSIFKKLDERLIPEAISEILVRTQCNPHYRDQMHFVALACEKLFELPQTKEQLQHIIRTLFNLRMTEEVALLIDDIPLGDATFLYLEGLCQRSTDTQLTDLLNNPDVLSLELNPLNHQLYCRLVAKHAEGFPRHELPAFVIHLAKGCNDYPHALRLMRVLHDLIVPISGKEFYKYSSLLFPLTVNQLHLVHQENKEKLILELIPDRRIAALKAMNIEAYDRL